MTDYRVLVSGPAQRGIATASRRVQPAIFEFMFGPLADNPYRVGKPLRGNLTGRYGARRGDWRVIYSIDDDTKTVLVERITHRADAVMYRLVRDPDRHHAAGSGRTPRPA